MKKNPTDLLANFLSSFGGAVHLLEKAKNNGYYIEQVCLCANIIDGLLRLSLIMEEQITSRSNTIKEKYLFQSEIDHPIFEKKIYTESKERKIINQKIYNQLNKLYDLRNKVIHRYIISDIKTMEVKEVAYRYYKMMDIILERHRKYHNKLVKLGIGISTSFIENPTPVQIAKQILKKHKGLNK